MTRGYTARILEPGEYEGWNRLVESAPEGSPYHDAGYLEVLCRHAGGAFRVLGVHDGEELVAGAPLYERRSAAGTYVQPRLLLYYNGVVLRGYDTRYPSKIISRHLGMMEALERGLRERGYAGTELRCRAPRTDLRPFLAAGWTVAPGYTYVVDLRDPDALWDRIDKNLRRLVPRAEEAGLRVTEDDDVESLYRQHRLVSEEKGAPLYLPRDRFRGYVRDLREREMARLFHARLPDGRAVSSALILVSGHPVTHTVCAAADPEHYDTGASPFLRWQIFRALAEDGYEANDLTDASLNSVSRFKRQLGSELQMNPVLRAPASPLLRMERGARRTYGRIRDSLSETVRDALATVGAGGDGRGPGRGDG